MILKNGCAMTAVVERVARGKAAGAKGAAVVLSHFLI